MKLTYLGTAAAEAIPALFCRCSTCQTALQKGGHDIRTRASILINDNILFDISPDINWQHLRGGIDLSAVTALVVTHSHSDHLDAQELTRRSTANYCHIAEEKPLQVYANARCAQMIEQAILVEFGKKADCSISVNKIKPFSDFAIDDIRITALPARHDENEDCLIYLIQDGQTAILIANDTGLPDERVYETIAESLVGKKLAVVSMDCTFGTRQHDFAGHMGMEENENMRAKLWQYGCADKETIYYLTHFSHNCGMNHQELSEQLGQHGFFIAYDNLQLEISPQKIS